MLTNGAGQDLMHLLVMRKATVSKTDFLIEIYAPHKGSCLFWAQGEGIFLRALLPGAGRPFLHLRLTTPFEA